MAPPQSTFKIFLVQKDHTEVRVEFSDRVLLAFHTEGPEFKHQHQQQTSKRMRGGKGEGREERRKKEGREDGKNCCTQILNP